MTIYLWLQVIAWAFIAVVALLTAVTGWDGNTPTGKGIAAGLVLLCLGMSAASAFMLVA